MAFNESNVKTFVASAVIAQNLRVMFGTSGTAGQMILAGAADVAIGVTERPSYAALDDIPVRLRTASGTVQMTAAGAFAVGAAITAAANGRVSTGGATPVGTALEAATAAGDIVEILWI